MRNDDIHHALSGEEEILPSSGFTASVMEAVRREAATPPPIQFPWKRALPGMIVLCVGIVWVLFRGVMEAMQSKADVPLPNILSFSIVSLLESPKAAAACWIVLGLLLSLASLKVSALLTAEVLSKKTCE